MRKQTKGEPVYDRFPRNIYPPCQHGEISKRTVSTIDIWYQYRYHISMASLHEIIDQMRNNPKDIRFSDLCRVCEHYFGEVRISSSHRIYKTPWQGDPRINIQDDNGKAKAYQVRQVLRALDKLRG